MLPKIPPTKLLSIQFSTIKPTSFLSYLNYKLLSYPCYSQIATTCSPNNNPLNKYQQVDFSNISLLSQNSALLRRQVGFHTRLIKCQTLKMFKSQLLSGEKSSKMPNYHRLPYTVSSCYLLLLKKIKSPKQRMVSQEPTKQKGTRIRNHHLPHVAKL